MVVGLVDPQRGRGVWDWHCNLTLEPARKLHQNLNLKWEEELKQQGRVRGTPFLTATLHSGGRVPKKTF